MKHLLTLILVLSTLADFTSGSLFETEHIDGDLSTICMDSDLHIDHGDDKSGSDESDHECHMGHLHSAVFYQPNLCKNNNISSTNLSFIDFLISVPKDFKDEIIRPPIA